MNESVGKIRANLIELWNRTIVISKEDNIYTNGYNNLYPNECERVIGNSPTASRCAKMMAKYIAGSGVLNEATGLKYDYRDLPIVNKKRNFRITDIISSGAKSLSTQGGVFIWVGWSINDNGELHQSQIEVLDYASCRASKQDDAENAGKIYFKNYEKKSSYSEKAKSKWFYPYNADKEVVMAQIKADSKNELDIFEAIKNYRGQVYYLNLDTELIYSKSTIDSVYNDADTEYRISIYTNKQVRSGFLGKTAVLTQGLDKEQADKVAQDLRNWLGAENSDSLYHMDVEQASSLDEVLKIIQVKGQYDEKMFSETVNRLRKNIIGAFGIPQELLNSENSNIFGMGSETFKEMKIAYSEYVEEEQEKLEECLHYLGFPVTILPIAKREKNDITITE